MEFMTRFERELRDLLPDDVNMRVEFVYTNANGADGKRWHFCLKLADAPIGAEFVMLNGVSKANAQDILPKWLDTVKNWEDSMIGLYNRKAKSPTPEGYEKWKSEGFRVTQKVKDGDKFLRDIEDKAQKRLTREKELMMLLSGENMYDPLFNTKEYEIDMRLLGRS